MQVSHSFAVASAVFDDEHLVSYAGLVPVMTLAEQTGLSRLLGEKVHIAEPRIKSGAANPSPKLVTVMAGMCVGADCIDDIDAVRSGGMTTLFDGVYAPSTVGTLLREFTFGHARQLESVLREHLVALCERVELLPGVGQDVFIDIDSLLRPVYGHAKQGASYGHTKIAGKQILRTGLSPLATTISTAGSAPVIAGLRLRAGRANSGKGAGRMVAQAIGTARAAGASGQILVRGDSAYGNRAVVAACVRHGAHFSLVMTRNAAIERAIAAIDADAWTPVRYPGAVIDPDTGAWISDAEVAEIPYTRLRVHLRCDHRPAGGAPGQGRPLPRRAVPGVALSPVLHQHRPPGRAGRHHPPPARHHRDRVRRFDRRTAGAPTLGSLRRQCRLDPVCGDRPQPAARCRRPGRRPAHPRTRIDATPQDRHRPGPAGPPATPTDPALTHPLALVQTLAYVVAQHDRIQPATIRASLIHLPKGPTETPTGKAGQTSSHSMPPARQSRSPDSSPTRPGPSVDRG